MGRAIQTLQSKARSERMKQLEQIRYALPTEVYLKILHEAAITGACPQFDKHLNRQEPVQYNSEGEHAQMLSVKERIDLLQYLVDKALPNYTPVTAPEPTTAIPDQTQATKDADFTLLSKDQLESIISQAHAHAQSALPHFEREPTTADIQTNERTKQFPVPEIKLGE